MKKNLKIILKVVAFNKFYLVRWHFKKFKGCKNRILNQNMWRHIEKNQDPNPNKGVMHHIDLNKFLEEGEETYEDEELQSLNSNPNVFIFLKTIISLFITKLS